MDSQVLSKYAALIDADQPQTEVLNRVIEDRSAWRASDFASPADYTVELTEEMIGDIDVALAEIKKAGLTREELGREHFAVPSMQPLFKSLASELRDGRGFFVLRHLPVEKYSKDDIEMVFWGVGLHLGRPMVQSVMGDRLGHVRDMTRTDPFARAYRNNDELSPHTDSAGIVGLACLRDAKSGGVSMLCSATTVHNVLLAERPQYLRRLYRGYVWHQRGEQKDGDDPVRGPVPVFSNIDGKVSVSYVRTFIEGGMAAIGRPISGYDEAVISYFLDVCQRPGVMLKFFLKPGELYFVNNYTILHSRSAFEDYEVEDQRRHLLRLWIEDKTLRPVLPGLHRVEITPVAGRTPSFDWKNLTSRRA